jgi:hypothetical protein
MGEYYRYEFQRSLFPDYPRPAVWPDGYYVPTSTSDDFIEKHICVADRNSMLKGLPATEQCVVIDGVSFLNTVDLDGKRLPPAGAPNIVLAAGGSQLKQVFGDDGIYVWQFKVDWTDSKKTTVTGPVKIAVAPYQFLCRGQLTSCVPQPDTDRRLDAQGDKLMARAVYRNLGNRESIVAVHSVNTEAAGGGVRWYEFQVGRPRSRGLIAAAGHVRAGRVLSLDGEPGDRSQWQHRHRLLVRRYAALRGATLRGTAGERSARAADAERDRAHRRRRCADEHVALGGLHANGRRSQAMTARFWYVGDYYKKDATNYSSRIGGFRLPGCGR